MGDCGACKFCKDKNLVDQTNSNNLASSGDVSTEVHHRVAVPLEVTVLKG